jgi:hypothetical protein
MALVSLVVCLAATGMWVRSYWVGDNLRWRVGVRVEGGYGEREFDLRSSAGGFAAAVSTRTSRSERGMEALRVAPGVRPGWYRYTPRERPYWWAGERTGWERVGFEFRRSDDPNLFWGYEHRFRGVAAPYWAVVLAAAVWPAWRVGPMVRRRRSRRWRGRGLCGVCGYDLRASVGRCPECGAGVGE